MERERYRDQVGEIGRERERKRKEKAKGKGDGKGD